MEHPVVLALLGTSFTFLATVAGAAMVFFVKKRRLSTRIRRFSVLRPA